MCGQQADSHRQLAGVERSSLPRQEKTLRVWDKTAPAILLFVDKLHKAMTRQGAHNQ